MEDPTALTAGASASAAGSQYEEEHNDEDLEERIALGREALMQSPDDPDALYDLAYDLRTRYDLLGEMDDLEESIALFRDALALRPAGDPDLASSLGNLANGLWTRYNLLGKMEDLEESIALFRNALALRPAGHPDRFVSLNNLARGLWKCYKQLGKMEDLEQSISLDRSALALPSEGYHQQCLSLGNLASGLWTRYTQLGKIEDLEESISLNFNALALLPAGRHTDQSVALLSNLAGSLYTQYNLLGKLEDLEKSISLHHKVLDLCPSGHRDQSAALNNLANCLRTRYSLMGKMEDLEESISLGRNSLALRPAGHPLRSSSLSNLASGLRTQYNLRGKMEDLEESISLDQNALALRPAGHPDQSASLSELAIGLRTRYNLMGKMEDLEESISLDRSSLALRPAGHPLRSSSLNNLAIGLSTRYNLRGQIDNLEESIFLGHNALALCPAGHPDQSISLSNLARGLRTRYNLLGKMEDLEESISLDCNALTLCPAGHPDRCLSLSHLANGLRTRYTLMGKMEDLEESISLGRSSLALHPAGHPLQSLSLSTLAIGLWTRYKLLKKMEDLEESISLDCNALTLCPAGHHHQLVSLSNLASGLSTRYNLLGKREDLEESISLVCDALSLCPAGHPDRSFSLHNLAIALDILPEQFGEMEAVTEMFLSYEQAATDTTSFLKYRLSAAIAWTQAAQKYQHQSLLHAYSITLELLQRTLISRPDVESQHGYLATDPITGSVASDAASAAIYAGNLMLAVEFLEQGRAMLWSKIDSYKYPLDQLRQVEGGGELADELERLSAELEHLVLLSDRRNATSEEKTHTSTAYDARLTRHRILSEEWDSLVGRIREKPGFAYFLKTPPFNTLQMAAADGPVIFINISKYRSDAIILTIEKPPILIPLPTIELVVLHKQVDRLTTNSGIIAVLRYLWEHIVSPVVGQLTELGVHPKSRIWWCPTAELCALPLHVAGPYRRGEENLQDLYTSSYISTLSSLIRARSNIVQSSSVPQLLVIGQHDTLPKVQEELGVITKGFGGGVNLLLGAQASQEAVLDSLRNHSWVHFACHGHLGDDARPFQASFELYNGRRLKLLDLIQARLPNAECAFLAACHSAAGDARTPDENIHLSAAMQFCGFRSVVGTLWEMFDDDGPMISKEFYSYMFRNPGNIDFRDSAHALNSVIQAMRKAKLPPERWAMFVHIGA